MGPHTRVSDAGPLRDGRAWSGAGVRKPPKEETAGRKGRPFGRARPMEILGSRTARVCRRGGRWGAILAETTTTSEFGCEDARPWRGRGGRGGLTTSRGRRPPAPARGWGEGDRRFEAGSAAMIMRCRAARRRKAERDMRIVGVLNHGMSIAGVAAREGVTERGMRKLIR